MSNKKNKGILLPTFLLSGLFFSFLGSFYYGMQNLTVIGGSSSDDFSHNFGETYSWKKGYDQLKTGLKGSFPETKCGALRLSVPDSDSRENRRETYHVFSEKCGELMGLSQFISSYSSGLTFGELLVKRKEQEEIELIKSFNELKSQGVLEDIRYKKVIIYDWGNIKGTALWSFIFPAVVAGALTYLVRLTQTKKKSVTNLKKG